MNTDPTEKISDFETNHLFLSFCSFCALLETKKINLANVFLLVLKENKFRDLFIRYCDFRNDYDALRYFLFFDSTLYKSKYIMKFLNSKQFNKL
ncbi:MAG: hypothetical protein EBU90_18215 [Proteobacteria bacterium]|nr:hypothetical protein [Pseudomonadota bacterium]NBP15665.1 hypothetical protein [bacterium]